MVRLRLLSVVATLALAGASAAPMRIAESTRLIASVLYVAADREERERQGTMLQPPVPDRQSPAAVPPPPPHVARFLTSALFQRPPPLA